MELLQDELRDKQVHTYILKKPTTSEGIINNALMFLLAVLIVAVCASFFTEELPGIKFDMKTLARDGAWLMLSSYAIGELIKRIFRNKGRMTDRYGEAKKKAKEALESLTPEELAMRNEYCREYEGTMYKLELDRILAALAITEEEWREKYAFRDKAELKALYPDMPKKALQLILSANAIKRANYDPSFFLSTSHTRNGLSPSQMYDADKKDLRNSLSSIVTTALGGVCAVKMAGDLIFSFSIATLFSFLMKFTTMVLFGSMKATFGWNLSMVTEIGRYEVIVTETGNLKAWFKARKGTL